MSDDAPFILGEGIRMWATFSAPTRPGQPGRAADPNLPVVFTVDPPEPAPNRVVEGIRDGTGRFYADTDGDLPGWWAWRAESAPPGAGVVEGAFEVKPSRVM